MPSSGDDTAGENAAASGGDSETPRRRSGGENSQGATTAEAQAALSAAIDADDDPNCALCTKAADYFLYEAGHVEKFVCWEHVSPHSAAVDSENARPGRPLALSL